MAPKVNPIPQGYHTVTPSLTVSDAVKALEFYPRAFGAEETMRMPGPDGKILHAEIRIGDSMIMLNDEMPDRMAQSPERLGGSPVALYVYVEDVDAAWKRALDAGAKEVMPLQDMFWGDRLGCVLDPFGYKWNLAQHVSDPSMEELKRGQEQFMAGFQNA